MRARAIGSRVAADDEFLLGAWDGDKLRYAGKVGTGFTGKTLEDVMRRLRPRVRETSPFADAPRERDVTWLEPTLVAQIGYTELTGDGRLRHPTFLGLRDDKTATEVKWPAPPRRGASRSVADGRRRR